MVVSVEDRDSLNTERSVSSGRGQLVKTAQRVFSTQGSRAGMLGVLMSCQEVELWWIRPDFSAVTSGLLPLSLSATSPGLELLFRVMCADARQLGHDPPVPPPHFVCAGFCFSSFQQLTPWGEDISSEEAAAWGLHEVDMERCSAQLVFSATAARKDLLPQDVVLKFHSGAEDEVRMRSYSSAVV